MTATIDELGAEVAALAGQVEEARARVVATSDRKAAAAAAVDLVAYDVRLRAAKTNLAQAQERAAALARERAAHDLAQERAAARQQLEEDVSATSADWRQLVADFDAAQEALTVLWRAFDRLQGEGAELQKRAAALGLPPLGADTLPLQGPLTGALALAKRGEALFIFRPGRS